MQLFSHQDYEVAPVGGIELSNSGEIKGINDDPKKSDDVKVEQTGKSDAYLYLWNFLCGYLTTWRLLLGVLLEVEQFSKIKRWSQYSKKFMR